MKSDARSAMINRVLRLAPPFPDPGPAQLADLAARVGGMPDGAMLLDMLGLAS